MSDNQNNRILTSGDVMPDGTFFVGIDPATGKGLLRTSFFEASYTGLIEQQRAYKHEACKTAQKAEEFDLPTPEQAKIIKDSLFSSPSPRLSGIWCKPSSGYDADKEANGPMILFEDGSLFLEDGDESGRACYVRTFDM